MNILYATPNSIYEIGGGSIEERKMFESLKAVTGRSTGMKLYTYSSDKTLESDMHFRSVKKRLHDRIARLEGHSNYMYIDWKSKKGDILNLDVDVLILGNSRLGFIAEDFAKVKSRVYIISHFHNIELDYCKEYMKKYTGITGRLLGLYESAAVKRDERDCVERSKDLLFLTGRDSRRAGELYDVGGKVSHVLPLCMNDREFELSKGSRHNMVFTGSLWYGPNEQAVKWFVDKVYGKIKSEFADIELRVGGMSPSKELEKFCMDNGVNMYADFERIEDVVDGMSIFIAPILSGAGMKTKVAEALRLGMPVLASSEALEGYEEAVADKCNNCIFRCDAPEDFTRALRKAKEGHGEFNSKMLFKKYYSMERAKAFFKGFFEDMRKGI